MMALSIPAHKQRDPARKPGQIVNPIRGHFPMGPETGRKSCQGSIESNDSKPPQLGTRKVPVFAASLSDDEGEGL